MPKVTKQTNPPRELTTVQPYAYLCENRSLSHGLTALLRGECRPKGLAIFNHINMPVMNRVCLSFLRNEAIIPQSTRSTFRFRHQIQRTQNISSGGRSSARLPSWRLQQQRFSRLRHWRILRPRAHPMRITAHTNHRKTRGSSQIKLFALDEIATRIPTRLHLATRIRRVFR